MRPGIRWMWLAVVLLLGLGMAGVSLARAEVQAAPLADEVNLEVLLMAPQHVAAGARYVVNLEYSNRGSLASPQDTAVTVTLPDGVTFIAAKDRSGADLPPDSISGAQLTWQVGVLQPGDCLGHIFIELEVGGQVAEDTALEVQAEIASSSSELDLANNTASVTSLVCDMADSGKEAHVRQARPGDVITYTIRMNWMRRPGGMGGMPGDRQMQLTDTLPGAHQVRFLGWSGPVSGSVQGNQLTWQGRLQAGEPQVLQYRLGVLGEVQPGEIITNRAGLGWGFGHMQFMPVTTVITLPQNARMVGPLGHQWSHQGEVDVHVPPGAVSETTRFEFHPLVSGTQVISGPPGWRFAHRAFEMNAFHFGEVHQFEKPITLTVNFGPQEIAGLQQNSLRLWYRSGPGEPWAMLGEPQQIQAGSASFTTTHFTQFALFGLPDSAYGYTLHLPVVARSAAVVQAVSDAGSDVQGSGAPR